VESMLLSLTHWRALAKTARCDAPELD